MNKNYTFKLIRKIIAETPNVVSPTLKYFIFSANFTIVSGKLLALNFIPNRFFSCATIISKAVDEENADTTGTDMKSTKKPATKSSFLKKKNDQKNYLKPNRKIPMSISTHPQTNVIMKTYSIGFSYVYETVTIDMSDVGPIETSLTVPKNM